MLSSRLLVLQNHQHRLSISLDMKCSRKRCLGHLAFIGRGNDLWYECDTCSEMGIVPSQMEDHFQQFVGNAKPKDYRIIANVDIDIIRHYQKMKTFRNFL